MKRTLTTLAAAAVLLAVAACTAHDDPTDSRLLADYRGETLDVAWNDVTPGDDLQARFIDMSVQFGSDPTFGSEGVTDDRYGEWTVLALCADATTVADAHAVEFGIIPTTLATTEVVRDAEAGRYDHDITCLGLTHRPA